MSQTPSRAELRAAIEDTLYTGLLLLDEQHFHAFLELTAPELKYRITAHSPEIRKEMTWLEHDRAGLVALFELLPFISNIAHRAAQHMQNYRPFVSAQGPVFGRVVFQPRGLDHPAGVFLKELTGRRDLDLLP